LIQVELISRKGVADGFSTCAIKINTGCLFCTFGNDSTKTK
jgi:hypothetical protein